jgi:hypothetical protein
LRHRRARHGWQCGSANGQMQKPAANNFHDIPTVFNPSVLTAKPAPTL